DRAGIPPAPATTAAGSAATSAAEPLTTAAGAPPAAATEAAPAAATPAVVHTPPPSPAIPPGEGLLRTPASAAGHRVFIDGRIAGNSPGPLRVPCGTHVVRVGSAGKNQTVEVPCGDEVTVTGSEEHTSELQS